MHDTDGKSGYIYILSNASIENMLKIGRTFRNPEERIKELSSATGVPTPFSLEYKRYFSDCVRAEELIHKFLELKDKRVSNNREFFSATIEEAKATVEMIDSKYFNVKPTETGTISRYISWYETDSFGNKVKISLYAENVSPEDRFSEVKKTESSSEGGEKITSYLTNDLNAFFGELQDEDDPTEELIQELIFKGEGYLEGYGGSGGLIDIGEGIKYLEKAISLGSAKACYILGKFYTDKYREDYSIKYLKPARNYFRQGIDFNNNEALQCLRQLANYEYYDSSEENLNEYIILNNTLTYWSLFFKKVKEIGINSIDSFTYSLIENSIKDLFTNRFYIYRVNENRQLYEKYKEALKEAIEILKYSYYDIFREYKYTSNIFLKNQKERENGIKFLEDTFDIKSINIEIKSVFEGDYIKPISIEKGNYEITGIMNGDLVIGDFVSLSVYPLAPRYFVIKNVVKDDLTNVSKIYIDGIYPEFSSLLHYIEYNKKNRSINYPIIVNKSGLTKDIDKDIEDIVKYCLNKEFEKIKIAIKEEEMSDIPSPNLSEGQIEIEAKDLSISLEKTKEGFFKKITQWFDK